MIDRQLLVSLFRFPAPTGQEAVFRAFVYELLRAWGVPSVLDGAGNLHSAPRPGLPLLVAHLDTAQTAADAALAPHIVYDENWPDRLTGLPKTVIRGQGAIGADDKAGVYLILDLLRSGLGSQFDFLFTVGEERHLAGARFYAAQRDWSKVPYCLVLDMWGDGNVVCAQRRFGSARFERDLLALDPDWETHSGFESGSDAEVLRHFVCTANLSVGYHRQHKPDEYLDVASLEKSLDYVKLILSTLKGAYRKV